MILSHRFKEAFDFAFECHKLQVRKNLPTPYISHLLSVCALVCENIDSICPDPVIAEDYAMTALLHDAIEDQGGKKTYLRILDTFGKTIADNVLMLSDSMPSEQEPRPPKQDRNRLYLEKMQTAPIPIVLISCCDKIHNMRSIFADHLILKDEIWNAYTLTPNDTFQNYKCMEMTYQNRLKQHRILTLYHQALLDMESILPTSHN